MTYFEVLQLQLRGPLALPCRLKAHSLTGPSGAALFQSQANVISVVCAMPGLGFRPQNQALVTHPRYMVLLFYSIYTSGNGRVKALRGVRVFNMPLGEVLANEVRERLAPKILPRLNMAAWAFYQCPSFPCPLLMDFSGSGGSASDCH